MKTKPHDHRYGAGRINPRRLGGKLKLFTRKLCRQEGTLLRITTNVLLLVLLVSLWKDESPLGVVRGVVDGLQSVFKVAIKLVVFFTG